MPYEMSIDRPPPYGLLDLRGDRSVSGGFAEVLGLALPQRAGESASNGNATAFWLGPDEWLVKVEDGATTALAASLRQAVDGKFAAVTILSDAYQVFRVGGPQCDDVLCQGIGVDLHAAAYKSGQCFRIAFSKTTILLHKLDDAPLYDLYATRSYATYVYEWLLAARGD